jgi:hypothetical protein
MTVSPPPKRYDQSSKKPINRPDNESTSQPVDLLSTQSINQLLAVTPVRPVAVNQINQSVQQPNNHLMVESSQQSISELVFVSPVRDQPITQSSNQFLKPARVATPMINQRNKQTMHTIDQSLRRADTPRRGLDQVTSQSHKPNDVTPVRRSARLSMMHQSVSQTHNHTTNTLTNDQSSIELKKQRDRELMPPPAARSTRQSTRFTNRTPVNQSLTQSMNEPAPAADFSGNKRNCTPRPRTRSSSKLID